MKKIVIITLTVVLLVGLGLYVRNQTPVNITPTELENSNEETEYTTHTFTCPSGDVFTITYNDQNEEATLVLEGDMAFLVSPAVSGSGARYTDADEHIEFWEHQGEATVSLNGEIQYEHCTVDNDNDTTAATTGISDLISVTKPQENMTVSSPIELHGEARGYWFFEASAPVVVVDWDGRIIGEGYVTAEEDWMTEAFVPFSGSVTYELPEDTPYKRGAVILRRDNPSDLPENDAAVEISVIFE